MKKYTPYILPLVVFGAVFLLVYRWYGMRTEQPTSGLLDEGVVIENLSEQEVATVFENSGAVQTTLMSAVESADTADQEKVAIEAIIRSVIGDEVVSFSVVATSFDSEYEYHVFLRDSQSSTDRYVFTLDEYKGGLMGSASVSTTLLPLELVVATGNIDAPENVVLTGTIEAPQE